MKILDGAPGEPQVLEYATPRRRSLRVVAERLLRAIGILLIGAGIGALAGFLLSPARSFEWQELIAVHAPRPTLIIPPEADRQMYAKYLNDRRTVLAILNQPGLADRALKAMPIGFRPNISAEQLRARVRIQDVQRSEIIAVSLEDRDSRVACEGLRSYVIAAQEQSEMRGITNMQIFGSNAFNMTIHDLRGTYAAWGALVGAAITLVALVYRTWKRPVVILATLCFGGFLQFCPAFAGPENTSKPKQLFTGRDLIGWTVVDKSKSALWTVVGEVRLDPKNAKNLVASGEPKDDKGVLVAQLKDFQGTNLVTTEKFMDFTLHVEFFLPKDGNSGIFLMGLYELQLTDSFGIADEKMQEGDHGGIPFFKKPLTNASLKPGEWQTADVTFRAPRFDDKGKKTANAKIVKAVINGKTVQQDLELPEPTGGGLDQPESASGPIMLQGNEGPVAFRNVTITPQP